MWFILIAHAYNSEERIDVPIIWMLLLPTMFPEAVELAGPKHSTSMPFSVESAVALSVDVNKVAFVSPNPVSRVAVKALPGPQLAVPPADKCPRVQKILLLSTLQRVIPLVSPVTLHLKVKVSPGQVGGAGVNCPATSPGEKWL